MHIKAAFVGGRYLTPTNENGKGFPDLVLGRHGVTHHWETKVEGRKPTADQIAWLEATGGRVVEPKDWDWIEGVLA